jgi:imidazolonepropionase
MRVLAALRDNPLDLCTSYLFRLPLAIEDGAAMGVAEWAAAELLPKIRRRRWAVFADLAWNPNPALLPAFERYLKAARGLGFACKIHADGPSPAPAIDLAIRHGAVGIDHLEYATEFHGRQLAAAGIFVTLLPGVSFHKDGQAPPVRSLIDSGVALALGTNFNPNHTPMLNMQTVVALACWHFRMTLEEAISAATINGAYALGCADRVGSLEKDKSADLVILNADNYRDLSTGIGTNLVHLTMKRGRIIYKEGAVAHRTPHVATPED